jgi:hypothetical protein
MQLLNDPKYRALPAEERVNKRASLLPRRIGTPGAFDENKLQIHYAWAIQCRLGEKSYGEIAKDYNVADFTIVRDGIETILKRLPPLEFVPKRNSWRKAVGFLLATLRKDSPALSLVVNR